MDDDVLNGWPAFRLWDVGKSELFTSSALYCLLLPSWFIMLVALLGSWSWVIYMAVFNITSPSAFSRMYKRVTVDKKYITIFRKNLLVLRQRWADCLRWLIFAFIIRAHRFSISFWCLSPFLFKILQDWNG